MNFKHLSWVLPFLLLAAPVQQPPAGQAGTTVELGRGIGIAGGRAWVPVSLTSAPGVRIGRLELTVTFPKALLTFVDVETSGLTEAVEAEVTKEVKDNEKDASQKVVLLRLSTLDGKATRTPLPDGKLAYLLFQVAKEAPPKTAIAVEATVKAETVDNPPKPVEPVTVRNAAVEVSEEAVSSCFFYMH